MIIKMAKGASEVQITQVVDKVGEFGCNCQLNRGTDLVVIAVFGNNTGSINTDCIKVLDGVDEVIRIEKPYKLASRNFHPENTIVKVGDFGIGGNKIAVLAGPCAVEDEAQLMACAEKCIELGVPFLRAMVFKPRSNFSAFQGLGLPGLKILRKIKKSTGLLLVTEVMHTDQIGPVCEVADVIQVGARNMQNFDLLKVLAGCGKPIILKRGAAAKIESEWLPAADYLLSGNGTPKVILLERGITTFEPTYRYTPDLLAIVVAKERSHLPVGFDPSHPTGNFRYVPTLAKAGVAIGADALEIEFHPNPRKAKCDGPQSLTFSDFTRLMGEMRAVASAIGRSI